MRGGPARNSTIDSLKSPLGAPKVRLPLALTKTELKRWPQISNAKGRKSSTEPSSPTGSGVSRLPAR